MSDNIVAHLFSQIEVKKHRTLIDDMEFSAITSTANWCVEYTGLNIYNGKAVNSGFKINTHEGTNFEAIGEVGDLGLGFFNYIIIPMYKGVLELIFTINNDNNVLYCWKSLKRMEAKMLQLYLPKDQSK
jgi:hypothetical protein